MRYRLTLDIDTAPEESPPAQWDWPALLLRNAGTLKIVECRELPAPQVIEVPGFGYVEPKPPTQGVAAAGFEAFKPMGDRELAV